MRNMKLALATLIVLFGTPAYCQVSGNLEVKVEAGTKLALYNSIASFRTDRSGEKAFRSADANNSTFKELPVGDYGVKLFAAKGNKLKRIPIVIHTDDVLPEAGAPYSGRWETNQFHMSKADMKITVSPKR